MNAYLPRPEVSPTAFCKGCFAMKDIYAVLRQKEIEQSRLRNQAEALRIVAPLLEDGTPLPRAVARQRQTAVAVSLILRQPPSCSPNLRQTL